MLHDQKSENTSDNSMINENAVCLQLKLLPSVNWLANVARNSELIINSNELYRKENHPNRYTIPTANGIINLSVPLFGGRNQKVKITDLKIAGDEWKRKHIHALQSSYGKSPYYLYYKDELENILLNSGTGFFELSTTTVRWLFKELLPEVSIVISECEFASPEIQVPDKKYHQVFENKFGFQTKMSAIDLLFCLGPDAKKHFI